MYGPAYELCENTPRGLGSEEYLNSEKYEIKKRDLYHPTSLRPFISRVNAIRKENAALHSNERLQFHTIDNDQLICYSKRSADGKNIVITIVNLDSVYAQSGFVELPLEDFGIDVRHPYRVTDLLNGARYTWQGSRNYVELRPQEVPAHIFRLE
jgi:starch synthase (maltosyl-transferring)